MLRSERLRRAWDGARRSGAAKVLLLCLVPVPVLLLTSALHDLGVAPFAADVWDVDEDRSLLEVWGYVLVVTAVCLLAVLALRRRRAVYAAWALALAVLVLDDAFQGHERGGAWLDRRFDLVDPPGLRTQDVGELGTWAAMGAAVLLVLWLAHRRSPARARRDSWWLVGLVLVLMTFAVGVDMFHVAVPAVTSSAVVDTFVKSLEAAGELAGMAGLLAYVVHVLRRTQSAYPAEPGRAALAPQALGRA